jgi:hypothetical protein
VADKYFTLSKEDQSEILQMGREKTGRPAHLPEKDEQALRNSCHATAVRRASGARRYAIVCLNGLHNKSFQWFKRH